jgi:hypothetical protein
MPEPVFFVVERRAGGEFPAIIRDRLPDRLTRKSEPKLLVDAVRLDKLACGARLERASTRALYRLYQRYKAKGTLPQNLADTPSKTPPRGRILGDWWTQPVVPWDSRAPAALPWDGTAPAAPLQIVGFEEGE